MPTEILLEILQILMPDAIKLRLQLRPGTLVQWPRIFSLSEKEEHPKPPPYFSGMERSYVKLSFPNGQDFISPARPTEPCTSHVQSFAPTPCQIAALG